MSDAKTQINGMTAVPAPSQQSATAEPYTVTVESPDAGGMLAYLVGPGATIDFGNINLVEAAMREENGNLRITLADGSEILLLDYVGASQSTQPPVLMSSSGTLTASQVMAQVLAADAFMSATPAAGAEICLPGEEHGKGEEVAAVEPAPVAKDPQPQPAAPAKPEVTVAELEENFDIEPAAGPESAGVISGNGFVPAASTAALLANSGIISSVIDPFGTPDLGDGIGEELQIIEDNDPQNPTPNQAINANNDSAITHCGDAVTINVLANDTDPDGDTLSVTSVTTQPTHGTAVLNANGTITYTPTGHFTGVDTFTYEITDGNGNTDTATVTVNVTNDAPDARNDAATTDEDQAVTINVLGNDSDPDGDPIAVTGITANPSNGSVVINANGTITYTPNNGFSGTDTFTYEITDDCGAVDTATVTVTVNPEVNDAPDARNDSATTHCGDAVTINVLSNDTDPNGDTLSVNRIVNQPSNGSVVINSNGTITYTPRGHFTGVDTFTYEITDGNGGTDIATVTVNVTNDAPDARNDAVSTDEDQAVTINVLTNDSDPDGDPISVTGITANPSNGSVVINANGTITYTPNNGFTGTDTFTYEITDDCGATDTATVTVRVNDVNDAPDARNDSATTHCGDAVTINVLANDSDPNGDTLSVNRIVNQPSNGSVVINSNGTITYTPRGHFTGVDTFTYEITDGNGGTDIATVTVNVTNDAPDARNDAVSTDEDQAVTINVLTNDSDPDGDPISVTGITANPSNGTVVINANGTITYTPNNGFTGTDTFTYEITDDCGAVDTATVTVRVNDVNDAPDARNDSATTHCGDAVTINVLANDTDPDGDTLSVNRIVNQPSNGTVNINANGTITYTPTGHFTGVDTFTYEITDGNGGTDIATVTVNVTNEAPDANNDSASVRRGSSVRFNVLSNDRDVDGDTIELVEFTQPQNGSLTYLGNGQFNYTGTRTGTFTFQYTIRDECGATDTATVFITVTAAPDDNDDDGDDCPLVIDLEGNGIEIISRDESNASFDLNGDGVAERTAWVGAGEAILAVDRNGDGMINGIDEVFGNTEMDGYTELAALEDTNGDGVVDANDAGFENLRLWIDANGNGVSDEGELHTLDEFGIVSINTNSTATSIQHDDAYIVEESTVTLEDGSTLGTGSVWYTNDDDNVILGTDGDDTLVMADTTDTVVGGAGEDVLHVVTEGDINLDNTSGIEVLDLTNDETNSVTLSAADVLNMNQDGTLAIMGDAEDEVTFTDESLTQTGTTELDGHTYATFSTDNGAELMIELGMTLNGETVQ